MGYRAVTLCSGEEEMSPNAGVGDVYVIAPTPFHVDGRVDEASADRMTDFLIQFGVTGITVLGQMGEAPRSSCT